MSSAQTLEQAHEVGPVGPLEGARPQQARDRKVGIDAYQVCDRRRFQLERRGVLAEVRDLDHALPAAPGDEKRLIALAAEILRLADEAEELSRARRHLRRGHPR